MEVKATLNLPNVIPTLAKHRGTPNTISLISQMSLMKDPEFIELDMAHGLPEHSTAERLERWKTEYLTGLREIHSIEKRAKDTVAKTQVGDAVVIHITVQPEID